jgi:hypothetical protein
VVELPLGVEALAQQPAFSHPTVDLLQSVEAMAHGISECSIRDWICSVDRADESLLLPMRASIELTTQIFICLE